MFQHETNIRVRYSETDKMGYLYYGHYPKYYEIGRVEAMRFLGIRYRDLEDIQGIMMPVMTLNMRYVRPAHYDELLTVRTIIRKMPVQTMTFQVEVFNEKKELVNGGMVKLCFVDKATGQTVNTPVNLIEKLQPYFG